MVTLVTLLMRKMYRFKWRCFQSYRSSFYYSCFTVDRRVTVVDYGITCLVDIISNIYSVSKIQVYNSMHWISQLQKLLPLVCFGKCQLHLTISAFQYIENNGRYSHLWLGSFRTTAFSFWCFCFAPAVGSVELDEVILNYENLASSLHLYKYYSHFRISFFSPSFHLSCIQTTCITIGLNLNLWSTQHVKWP